MEDHTQNEGEKLFADFFLEILNWEYLWINTLKFNTVCFYLCQVEAIKCIEIWAADHLLLPRKKLFQKTKIGLDLVSLPRFLHGVWRKILLLLYSINWPNFNVWLHVLYEILSHMCIVNVCKPGCDVITFEINLIFPIKPFFLLYQKFKRRN